MLIFAHSTRHDTIITSFDRWINWHQGEFTDWLRVQNLLMCRYTFGALDHDVTMEGWCCWRCWPGSPRSPSSAPCLTSSRVSSPSPGEARRDCSLHPQTQPPHLPASVSEMRSPHPPHSQCAGVRGSHRTCLGGPGASWLFSGLLGIVEEPSLTELMDGLSLHHAQPSASFKYERINWAS